MNRLVQIPAEHSGVHPSADEVAQVTSLVYSAAVGHRHTPKRAKAIRERFAFVERRRTPSPHSSANDNGGHAA